MTVNRERGAVVHHVQAGSACRPTAQKTGAPLSGSAAQEVYGLDDRDDTVAVRGGGNGFLAAPDVTSYLAQPPARSGAGGPGRNSEAGREEPEALESALAAVGGAR